MFVPNGLPAPRSIPGAPEVPRVVPTISVNVSGRLGVVTVVAVWLKFAGASVWTIEAGVEGGVTTV